MQTADKVTTTEEALAEFKEADAKYTATALEVQRFYFAHPARTKTIEFAVLEAKRDELGRDRQAKLARWSALKPNTDTFTTPPEIRPICEKCGSALMVLMNGVWHCNSCGFQN